MADEESLTIDEIRSAVGRALDATEQLLGPAIDLAADYYWHLPVEGAFDMSRDPNLGELTVGQLSDDLATIRDQHEVDPHLAWHELAHVTGVLRALERRARP